MSSVRSRVLVAVIFSGTEVRAKVACDNRASARNTNSLRLGQHILVGEDRGLLSLSSMRAKLGDIVLG